MNGQQPPPPQQQFQATASPEDLKGRYSNGMVIQHSKSEFVVDFFLSSHQTRQLITRVVVSPAHLKSFLKALGENIERYESSFGKIESLSAGDTSQDGLGYKIEK